METATYNHPQESCRANYTTATVPISVSSDDELSSSNVLEPRSNDSRGNIESAKRLNEHGWQQDTAHQPTDL